MDNPNPKYEEQWNDLYDHIVSTLAPYGVDSGTRDGGDYWVVDEPYGYDQHKVFFFSLRMLDPKIVNALKNLLNKYPGWEIFVAIFGHPPEGDTWPEMGLIIREHEIIDGLQRQYFPPEYQSVQYEGSRVGTDRD